MAFNYTTLVDKLKVIIKHNLFFILNILKGYLTLKD